MKRFNLFLAAFAIIAVAVGCKPDPVLTLTTASDSSVTFEIPGGTKTVTFNANYAWTAASSDSWVTVSPASGSADAGSITLTAAANTTSSERTATVTITMETLKQTITCKQGAQVLKLSNSDDASWSIRKGGKDHRGRLHFKHGLDGSIERGLDNGNPDIGKGCDNSR